MIFFRFTSFYSSSSKTTDRNSFTISQLWDLIEARLTLGHDGSTLDSLDFQKEFVLDLRRWSSLMLLKLYVCFLQEMSSIFSLLVLFRLKQSFYFCFEQLKLCFGFSFSFSSFDFSINFSINLIKLLVNYLLPLPTWLFFKKCSTSPTNCWGNQKSIYLWGLPKKCFFMISPLTLPNLTDYSMIRLNLSTSARRYSLSFLTLSKVLNSFSLCLNSLSFF